MDYERMTWRSASRICSKTELRHHRVAQNLMLKLREDSNLSIHYYAKKQGYCSDHLCRIFRKVVGMSPKAFAVRVRIDHARQLLQESSLSISEIANVLGYEDVYFFSKQFKEKISFSPTEYRLSNNR